MRALVPILALLLWALPASAQPFAERYRERVAQFERENARLSPASRSVVLFGSSSMEGWKNGRRIERFLPSLAPRVRNRGISGDGIGIKATTGLYNRIRTSVTGASPTHVFVLNGRNSLGYGAQRVATRYREVIAEIRRTSPNAVVTIVSCAPVRKSYTRLKDKVVALNRRLRFIAGEQGALFFDLHARLVDSNGLMKRELTSDGLHFKDEGYRILGAEIERIVSSGETPVPATPTAPAPTLPTPTAPAPTPATREVAVGGLNLRSGPGRDHPVLSTLTRGTQLEVLRSQGPWLEVRAGAQRGWVHGAFTASLAPTPTPSPASTPSHQVSAGRLNVRRGPGLQHARLGTLSEGTRLEVLARQGEWWEVRSGTRRGWVHSGYLEGISSGITGSIR